MSQLPQDVTAALLDEQIDRALQTLDHTHPAAGLEDRVFSAIAARNLPLARSALFPRLFAVIRQGPGSAVGILACAVVLLVCGALTVRFHRTRERSHAAMAPHQRPAPQEENDPLNRSTSAANVANAANAANAANETNVANRPASAAAAHAVPAPPIHLSLSLTASVSPAADASLTSGPASPEEAAVVDFHTPSFPAPPQPLTAQERSVRLMLRHGEKHDLAQLDPARTTSLANTEARSFQTFFDPDPSPELALELKKGNHQ